MAKTMTIDGKEYTEAKPPKNWAEREIWVCSACALNEDGAACGIAIDFESEAAFGGDCQTRDVVYQLVTKETQQ